MSSLFIVIKAASPVTASPSIAAPADLAFLKRQFAPFVAKSEITHHIVQNCCLRSFRKKKLPMCMAHSQKQGCESAKGKKEKETKVMSAVQPWRKESS